MSLRSIISNVQAWEEQVTIPTYPSPAPDKNPMFVDKRVYQGSSGKVYPNPFTDRISDKKIDRTYQAVFLENKYVHLMILPEIGGRIHVGQDKTNQYDFFYRQNVIKPALVGLLGPWISGGVEFNWPQHHRPSTYMPVQYAIEQGENGSRTVWLSEHDPMDRMKGMVGICLHPDKSIVEAKVRLYNRTAFIQTFLWWANVGIRVHDQYQAFFPPDVTFVADHAKRAMSWYPIARNYYYGVDYTSGIDISWYKNIPVPTSYMVAQSNYDFLGGYDHAKRAGMVHVADHHIAPGKKLWTWGNGNFGYAWDRELTDEDGPYIELMSGVYTDNQPDFSWLQPYETKNFSQFWYPIQEIGPAKNANTHLAINLEHLNDGKWKVGVCPTEELSDIRIELACAGKPVLERCATVRPGQPLIEEVVIPPTFVATDLLLRVVDRQGRELIRYAPEKRAEITLPHPAIEPLYPAEIRTNEELYITGLHLYQYRHTTRYPEPYWREALQRDACDARCNNALGILALRRGSFEEAQQHFDRAICRLTEHNPNPYDGEAFYNLGLALQYQKKDAEAYNAFYKATWNYSWRAAAYYSLAEIDCKCGALSSALEHIQNSQSTCVNNLKARNLEAAILRRLGKTKAARRIALETAALDRLDFWSRNELLLLSDPAQKEVTADDLVNAIGNNPQNCLDLAFDYANAGLWPEAEGCLERFLVHKNVKQQSPMLFYAKGYFAERQGDVMTASSWYKQGSEALPDYCFPSRLEEMMVLQAALQILPGDAHAHYYLGNLLYDKQRREEAIEHWERAVELEPAFSIPSRNLGIAYYNVRRDPVRSMDAYRRAFTGNPQDARLLYELDQLRKRIGVSAEERLAELEKYRALVDERDDLTIELVTLYNETGQSERALAILERRRFHPWEGGEGLISGQYAASHLLLGRDALEHGDAHKALCHFEAARNYPHNLGEGKHLLTQEADLDYFMGLTLTRLGRHHEAEQHFRSAAAIRRGPNRQAFYSGLALRELGDESAANEVLRQLEVAAEQQIGTQATIDFFATSLPNFLLFEDDLQRRNQVDGLFLRALSRLGLGKAEAGLEDLRRILDLDRNHLWAAVEFAHTSGMKEETAPNL